MLAKSIAALAALSFAAGVAAEPMPNRPVMVKMSTRSLFGIGRRQENPGYQPEPEVCGVGATCSEACGDGYATCTSGDDKVHCYNPNAGEVCCPNMSGSCCEAGYYCSADNKGETWCCPEGMGLEECAAAYDVEGGLFPQTPPPAPTTSAPAEPTETEPATTAEPTTTAEADEDDEDDYEDEFTSTSVGAPSSIPSFLPSSTYVRPNSTAVETAQPVQPTETIVEGAGSVVAGPATALVLLAAGLAALL